MEIREKGDRSGGVRRVQLVVLVFLGGDEEFFLLSRILFNADSNEDSD